MDLEVFDLTAAVEVGERDAEFCARLARCLHDTSCLIVRDPRVSMKDSDRFLDLMERYFAQPMSKKQQHSHPELRYQVGLMPGGIEKPEALEDAAKLQNLKHLAAEHQPRIPEGPDPKCRYMWRIGPRPKKTDFYELNAEPVIPEGFEEWETVMNSWGEKLLNTILIVSELLSVGLGWDDVHTLTKRMQYGPHVLAPTGVDVSQHRELNTCIAGFHTDLNLLTAHGKSRFPGLFIWLRNGKRIPVKIPDGCILLQAGMQLERLTGTKIPSSSQHAAHDVHLGGYIRAGLHEVVISEDTLATLQKCEAAGKCTWRVSSTLFGHVASDVELAPLGKFKTNEALQQYPPLLAGEQVGEVLTKIL